MPTPANRHRSLWDLSTRTMGDRFITDHQDGAVAIAELRAGNCFSVPIARAVRDRCVLLATKDQRATVLSLIAMDGIARRILLFTPDLVPHLASIIKDAEVDCLITDGTIELAAATGIPSVLCHNNVVSDGEWEAAVDRSIESEWVIFTSGTTGKPKMVAHTLATLSGPIEDGVQGAQAPTGAVWSTFYDVRRYGGIQILLRALIGGGSMVLSSADEPVSAFLSRLAAERVTHISGTPSHWRLVLMSPEAGMIQPDYVRMSGEVADQAIIDRLRAQYRHANVAHAFASTEAGVGFDVRDGKAGFPVGFVPHPNGNPTIELKVANGTLHIRSARIARGYLANLALPQSDGFIDSGDLVERRGDRFYFMGRREGVINVGGQKVFPEEVEDVITQSPNVLMARVWARPSPVTGSLVAADIVPRPRSDQAWSAIKAELIATCARRLARHKVPVSWQQVDSIAMTASGKIQRTKS